MFVRLIAVRSDRLKPYRVQCVQRHAYRLCHALRLADCTRLVNQQNASEHPSCRWSGAISNNRPFVKQLCAAFTGTKELHDLWQHEVAFNESL